MNILYLCPSQHLGVRDRAGWSTHMRSVITGLRDHGHSVRPYMAASERSSPQASHSWLRRITPASLRLARRDVLDCLHDHRLDHALVAACQESYVEAIYERTEVYHAVGMRVARRLGLPLVIEVNGPLVDERISWGGLLVPGYARRLENAKYAAADRVVTVSRALGEHLAAHGVDAEKIEVIPNGADTSLFHPRRAHPGAVRQKFGLGRRLVIGFVGAFADWHGLNALIEAAEQVVHNSGLDVHLLLVGEGPSRPELREQARRSGLDGRVTLPGSIPHAQVPHYMAAMDLCVLPRANWYMSPIKLFEYGAMGRAVIAPRTPAIAEVMVDGEDGLLVTPGSVEEIARAVVRLARDPAERARMAATFQHRVRQHHSWTMIAGRVSQLLEQSLRTRRLSPAPDLPPAGREGVSGWHERAEGS
jgi:glycosyltransferase involved in cell wall biosynthesis